MLKSIAIGVICGMIGAYLLALISAHTTNGLPGLGGTKPAGA